MKREKNKNKTFNNAIRDWRHKRKLSDWVGQSMNNANPATFPGVEPFSTNATMWLRRNGENSEMEKERMYNEGQEEIVKAYELQWGAFTRADLERCRLKKLFHKSQHSSRMERKKTFPRSTDNTPHTYKVFTVSDSACACEQHWFDTDKTHLVPLSLKCCLFLLTEELNYDHFNTQKLFFGTKTLIWLWYFHLAKKLKLNFFFG